jgi:hypothetical protein
MLIDINTDTLLESKLTAHQFMIAWYMLQNKYRDLETYLEQTSNENHVREDLDRLYKLGFLMELSLDPAMAPKDYQPTIQFKELFSEKGDFFKELYNEYPVKVIRPDGMTDYLRADRNSCERIYVHLTRGNKQVHDHIMKCLRYEINKRHSTGTINYMKRLNKWLSSREWESYEDEVDDLSSAATRNEGEHRYGTELG